MVSVLGMKDLRLREVKWFERSQVYPKPVVVSILGEGVGGEGWARSIRITQIALKALCPQCHPASFPTMRIFVGGRG